MKRRSADQVTRVLRQREVISYFGGEDSEEEIDSVEEADSDASEISDSDLESEENENEIEDQPETGKGSRRRKFVYGKDKHKLCLTAPETEDCDLNIIAILPKVIGPAVSSLTPLQVWSALFTQDILEIILKYTNAEIQRYVMDNGNGDCASYQTVTLNELKAFIGLLYLCGVQNNNKVNVIEIWSREFGSTLCKVTMSQRRFEFISCRLRFDDKTTRAARRAQDVFAPIREIWNIFIKNCQKNYIPSQFLTIDELLLDFCGRFSARVYIKSKPSRYGIKIVSMNDAKTFYMYNAIPYTGKVPAEQGESAPSYYVRKLSEPIHNTDRSIICDNRFTSVEICNRMKQEFNLSIVDTSRYGHDGQNILSSNCPKKNKVVLSSSMHKTGKASEESGKPEMIQYYNKNKCGTHVFDQLCRNYSCARTSNRWSMRFFLAMLDQARVNSCILYNLLPKNENKNRREFLKELALSAIKPHLKERATKPGLHKSLANGIQEILSSDKTGSPVQINRTDKLEKRKRCYFCKVDKDRKTQYCCVKCQKAVCDDHRLMYCTHCIE